MKKRLLLLSVLLSCSAIASDTIEAGKMKSQSCAACHGVDGNSVITMYPKLAGQHKKYLVKQLKDFKLAATSGGKQGRYEAVMSAFSTSLSEKDIDDLAIYYASQSTAENDSLQNIAEQGRALYLVGDTERGITACVACHGPNGNGTALSGFPKISGQHSDYIKAQLEKFASKERSNDLNGMMQDISQKLTIEEMGALAKYVQALN